MPMDMRRLRADEPSGRPNFLPQLSITSLLHAAVVVSGGGASATGTAAAMLAAARLDAGAPALSLLVGRLVELLPRRACTWVSAL